MENSEENTYPNPFTTFMMRLAGTITFAVVALALIVAWHTFLSAAPIIIQVVLFLLAVVAVGAMIYLATDKFLDIRHKHLRAVREQQRHDVQLHMMQSRIHADERGNKPSLLTASGQVVNLPSGNYVQPVSTTYSPHISYASPKATETRVTELPNIQASLPAPSVPTFAQLLASGETRPHEVQSILGYTDGKPRRGDWDKLHSFFVVGISGSGKSSTVAYFTALAVMHGAKLLVIDPDAEEEQSISKRIAPLSFALLTPIVSSPQGVGRVLDIAAREIMRPSPYPIVWICDEFSTMMRSPEWADVAPQLATGLEDYAQRGRKRGRTAIVIGQIAKASRTGGTELRESMTATFIHRTKASQARMVIDGEVAKDAPTLAIGEVMVQLVNAAEPYRMSIPEATEDDMDTVQAMMCQRSSTAQVARDYRAENISNLNNERTQRTVNAPERDVERIRTLYLAGLPKPSKRAIIEEVWGIKSGGSQAWQEASRKYEAIIAEIEQQKEEA